MKIVLLFRGFLIAFFSLLFYIVSAQNEPQYFYHLTKDDGLSSNRVNYITEDSLGFIWIGTEYGLGKYNGYTIKTQSLSNETHKNSEFAVNYILEDIKKPNLWLATSQGLLYFDRYLNKTTVVLSNKLKASKSGNISITSLSFDKKNNLWVGTHNGLYLYLPKKKQLLTLIKANTGTLSQINTLYKDHNNIMWIGSEAGVFRFNEKDSTFKQFFKENKLRSIQVILQDFENNYWIGSNESGLFYIKGGMNNPITRHFCKQNGDFIVNRIYGVIEGEPGIFYILVRDGGLYQYNVTTNQMNFFSRDIYNPNSINSSALISGFRSSQGIIWLGTYNSGIDYINNAKKKFTLYKVNYRNNGLFNNNIRSLAEDSDGYIWIGTKEDGGLSRFDRTTGTFKNYKKSNAKGGLKDDYIFSICELDKNRLLLGTFREGLAIFNKRTENFTYFVHDPNNPKSISDNRVYSIFKDLNGIIWVGNYHDLQIFDPNKQTFTTIKGIPSPRCFCQEDRDRIWIGTKSKGLFLYNEVLGSFYNYIHNDNDTNSLINNDIYAIKKDTNGNLWIGTKQGINKFILKTNRFFRYTKKDGLPSNWICGLLIDSNNNVWASTSNGLTKFDEKKYQFKNYDVKDGLQGYEFEGYVALKTKDGHMLFGGRNGLNMFLPSEITDNKKIPNVFITDLKIFNKALPIGKHGSPLRQNIIFTKKIILKHNQSTLTFSYVALNFISAKKNHYAYKMEGFDNKWINAGISRTANYTNLPPGTYTFRVRASNNDNYWNNKGASLKIIIKPAPWMTVWAYLFYVLLLMIILYYLRKFMIMRIEQKNLLEFEKKDKKRIQEINKSKLEFFTNISHEFRTPLTLIGPPLDKLMNYKSYNDEQQYLFKVIDSNVKRLLLLVTELMYFRKAENNKLRLHVSKENIEEFIQNILINFYEKAEENGINMEFKHYQVAEKEEYWFDKNIIDKVIFNLLSNAFKHTPVNGKIEIILRIIDDYAYLSVINSGDVIPEEKIKYIFERFYQFENNKTSYSVGSGIGLAFSKRLIEVHKGTISVKSDINNGTNFTIKFPIHKSKFSVAELTDEKVQGDMGTEEQEKVSSLLTETSQKPTEKTPIRSPQFDKKLLIVEDDDELRKFMERHFSNYHLFTANNGKSAIEIAREEIPDIVISDVMMPEMDGFEFCRQLKTHFSTSHIPVILLTAKTDITFKIKGLETGADAYIEKPFHMDYLQARIDNLLLQREMLRVKFSGNPDLDIKKLGLSANEERFIQKTKKIIEENMADPEFSVEKLGAELGLSRSQLFRKLKAMFRITPSEIIRMERLKYAKTLLSERNHNVNEVADLVGFNSTSYFITSFKKHYGKTPMEFIRDKK